jgi:hypothetical protein
MQLIPVIFVQLDSRHLIWKPTLSPCFRRDMGRNHIDWGDLSSLRAWRWIDHRNRQFAANALGGRVL